MSAGSVPQPALPSGFTRRITIEDSATLAASSDARARQLCGELETGHIVFLPRTPIELAAPDRELLLGRRQSSSAYHKNIAYRPLEDRVTGFADSEQQEAHELRRILKDFSRQSVEFLFRFLSPYAGKWKLDFASFRPIEEEGRPARLHARNDLLHFDSFPTRPTNGSRILRFFTNLNPAQNRVWITSQTFESFGPRFALATGLLKSFRNPLSRGLRAVARTLHIPGADRPPYDELMHRCHNAMKEDSSFQEGTPKQRWEFPPGSSWMVFTDCVSHAVLSGQYALEQTFIVPQSALTQPERSPLAILEKLAGRSLTI
ncbi:MAG TPA: Kdo hydroxylase family protein [Candidatus Limnocylindrales bacterium]|nr:Kdo hydroxylase family protein [Candidatus Limnocylindrales bacterium]